MKFLSCFPALKKKKQLEVDTDTAVLASEDEDVNLEEEHAFNLEQLKIKESELSTVRLENLAFKKEIGEAKQALVKVQEEKAKSDAKLIGVNTELDVARKQRSSLNDKIKKLNVELSDAKKEQLKLGTELDIVRKDKLVLKGKLDSEEKRRQELEIQLGTVQQKLEETCKELAEKSEKLDSLQKQIDEDSERRNLFVNDLETQAKGKYDDKLYVESVALWYKAIGVEEANRNDPTRLSSYWNSIAMCREKLKQFKQAFSDVGRAIEYKPDEAVCYYNRACYSKMINNRRDAIDDLKKAIQLRPDYDVAKDLLAKFDKK